ncbi:hypothetical protein Back11_51150 [Paenibacillus baekrokdamisoli]|uniref:Uncharacterized protein n=1 Tax=Paenibacillus baekrokdamisoli TaxID=1712516 RepID=A0A3G9IY16_9BACL|nr:hypothetical protein [Paenibacillus baekrokdamisoli]MBB3068949.1 (p)ppGpp synthase/HD superfamily hydrolase [Paenibacillus baekrokdamisoli]BBH23770.1 hypothetical protein Back11_51150 [Paenibacillus baekrokdamisoli]
MGFLSSYAGRRNVTTSLVVISLFALNKLTKLFARTKQVCEVRIRMEKTSSGLGHILTHLNRSGLQIDKLTVDSEDRTDLQSNCVVIIHVQLKFKKLRKYEEAIAALVDIEGIIGLETAGLSV